MLIRQVYAVRLSPKERAALERAAAGENMRPRTLARELITAELQRRGFLKVAAQKAQA